MKTVIIVDDHPVTREGLKTIIRKDQRFEFLGEAEDARSTYKLLEQVHPDLMIVDVGLPGENGIDLTSRIKLLYPKIKILILSYHINHQFVIEAVRAGAVGYIGKEFAPTLLLDALEKIALGEKYYDQRVIEAVVAGESETFDPVKTLFPSLTVNEENLWKQIFDLHTNQEIADRRGVTVKAIEKQRSNLFKKINVSNEKEAIKLWYEIHTVTKNK